MTYRFGKTVVIALGGSIVHPDEIDVRFLKQFRSFVLRFVRRNMRFVIVVGGGKLCRCFQDSAGRIARVTDEDKDWIGIHATRLNAHLLRTVFREVADPVIVDERRKIKRLRYPVTIASGWRPGWSTDFVATQIATDFGAPEVVIAGKPAYVFDKDPAKYRNARRFTQMTWRAYRRLVPAKWKPGLHAPVDPVAARLAERAGVAAIIVNGRNLKNFGNLLNGKEFKGTIVR